MKRGSVGSGEVLAALVASPAALVALTGCSLEENGGSAPAASRASATVVSITDGDTIEVSRRGHTDEARLLAIDAPESSALRYGAADCGGEESKSSMAKLLAPGDRVRLIADPSQDRRDRYGRLLAYVERHGVDVGREQLRRGLAETYVFDSSSPARRTDDYRRVQGRAEASGAGVYRLCGGDFHAAEN